VPTWSATRYRCAFPPSGTWYFLDDVDVQVSPRTRGTIVAFGDSITDGSQSTVNANARWPNDLARRILAGPPGQVHPVVDEGISGDRILNDSVCFGVNAQARFTRDVAARTGARYVVLLEGINDIGFSQTPDSGCTAPNTDVSADQIIAGYRHLIAAAHAAGLKIIGGTLIPFQGSFYYSAAAEAKREAVNQWIRTSGAFDGVIDFDAAVRDPASPLQLLPAYDSGDHLHPNDAGYQAMAAAIDLSLGRWESSAQRQHGGHQRIAVRHARNHRAGPAGPGWVSWEGGLRGAVARQRKKAAASSTPAMDRPCWTPTWSPRNPMAGGPARKAR
jgi:lysophospholipase L1-like esterase